MSFLKAKIAFEEGFIQSAKLLCSSNLEEISDLNSSEYCDACILFARICAADFELERAIVYYETAINLMQVLDSKVLEEYTWLKIKTNKTHMIEVNDVTKMSPKHLLMLLRYVPESPKSILEQRLREIRPNYLESGSLDYKTLECPDKMVLQAIDAVKILDWKTARSLFETIKRKDPYMIRHMDLYVQALRELREKQRACAEAKELQRIAPHTPEAYTAMATMETILDSATKAMELLNKALKLDPGHLNAQISKANLLLADGFYEESNSMFHALYRQGFKQMSVYKGILESSIMGNLKHNALEFAKELKLIYPQNKVAKTLISHTIIKFGGDLNQAILNLQEILQEDPSMFAPIKLLCDIYEEKQDFQRAFGLLKAHEKYFKDESIYMQRAHLYTVKKEYINAAKWIEQALKLNPTSRYLIEQSCIIGEQINILHG